jgi:hypothetical protein
MRLKFIVVFGLLATLGMMTPMLAATRVVMNEFFYEGG